MLLFCSWFLGELTTDSAINFMKERVEIKTFVVYKNLDNNTYTYASKSIDSTIEMREINSCESKYRISGEVSLCATPSLERHDVRCPCMPKACLATFQARPRELKEIKLVRTEPLTY